MDKPDGERLVRLETHMQEQDRSLDEIKSDIKDIKVMIQKQDGYESRISALEKKVEAANNPLLKWVGWLVSGGVGAVFTFLVINFLQNSR